MALVGIGDEELTVSTTGVNITTGEITTKVLMAVIQHRSGGKIYERIDVGGSSGPSAGAGNGEFERIVGDIWEVWGHPDLNRIEWIKQTGEADATLAVQTFGEG